MNEFEVLRRISALLPPAPPEVLVPLGDDCAVLEIGGSTWVAASDMLVSGHHFEDWATPEDVGYKAVAVNASDVASMGEPRGSSWHQEERPARRPRSAALRVSWKPARGSASIRSGVIRPARIPSRWTLPSSGS